jgi:hypothetical protein
VGCKIDEVAEVMLVGLPDEFNPLVMGIEGTQTKLTSESVKTRLMQGDYRRSKSAIGGSEETAYAAGIKKSIFVPVCHNCNMEGHIKPRCLELKKRKKWKKKGSQNSDSQQSSKSNVTLLLTTHTARASSVSRNDDWLVDSGSTSHTTKYKDWLVSYLKREPSEITVANDQKVHSNGVDEVKVNLKNSVQKTISEVMFVPGIAAHLLSVNKITERGYVLLFDDKQCRAFDKSDVKIIGSCKFTASNVDGVYELDQNLESSSVAVE